MAEGYKLIHMAAISAMEGLLAGGMDPDGREAEIARKAFALADAIKAEALARQLERLSPENKKKENLERMAPELLHGVRMCLAAENERAKKLKSGSPASSYTLDRIKMLENLIDKANAG